MLGKVLNFIENEKGATAIEYGLIALLIATVIIGAVAAVGTKVGLLYQSIVSNFPSGS